MSVEPSKTVARTSSYEDSPHWSVFAVWRWPKWILWICGVLAALSPVLYTLSIVPFVFVMSGLGFDEYEIVGMLEWIYGPVLYVNENSDLLNAVLEWEIELFTSVFGDPYFP